MIHIFDGAIGTMLQNAGLKPGACPELLNIEQPETVRKIHKAYVDAGSTIIETNTFGASALKLEHYGLADRVEEINIAAVKIVREARSVHSLHHAVKKRYERNAVRFLQRDRVVNPLESGSCRAVISLNSHFLLLAGLCRPADSIIRTAGCKRNQQKGEFLSRNCYTKYQNSDFNRGKCR